MKDFSNFCKDLAGLLIILVGIAGIAFVFFYFLRQYQADQHSHERDMQAVQIDHEKTMAIDARAVEGRSSVKKFIGSMVEKAIDVGQKFIGL